MTYKDPEYSEFQLHYAFSFASALFSDYLRRNPDLSVEKKSEAFRDFVESGLFEARSFSNGIKQ